MSDKVRKVIITVFLAVGAVLCLSGMIHAVKPDRLFGHADPNRQRVETDRIQIRETGFIQVNTDDPEELTVLPGIGETIASVWVSEYLENGPFYYPEDLLSVKGIGEKKLASILSMIDLSTADR